MEIIDYDSFCAAFNSDDKNIREKAELLLYIQNCIIRISDDARDDMLDYSLKEMTEQLADKRSDNGVLKDYLSRIISDCAPAFRYISHNMREKIIREEVLMPAHKVRELNSYCMNWLSRKPGDTVRQKVSSAGNSIMAVKRRMCLDTAENRLFLAFAREMLALSDTKTDSLRDNDLRLIESESDFASELVGFLRNEELSEIRRWENLPPNNTLLSDRYYRKIWNAWNEVKRLDERIKSDSEHIDGRIAFIFLFELIVRLEKLLIIPQLPVEVDYDECSVSLPTNRLLCLDKDGNTVEITLSLAKNYSCISIKSVKNKTEVRFSGNNAVISVDDNPVKDFTVNQSNVIKCVEDTVYKTGLEKLTEYYEKSVRALQPYKSVIIDLFSLHPGFIGINDTCTDAYRNLSGRILQQTFKLDDKEYCIPCDNTNAIMMKHGVTRTYTIPYAVDNGMEKELERLIRMVRNYIVTDELIYMFPDAYNDLQLSKVHKAARMSYGKVRNIPKSICAAYKLFLSENFRNTFKPGDFLLVLDLLDDDVTLTLVGSKYDKKLEEAVPDTRGIVWERHPTYTSSYKKVIDKFIIDKLLKVGCHNERKLYSLLGIDGLSYEAGKLSILFGEEWFSLTSEDINSITSYFGLNITKAVEKFLTTNRKIVGESEINIISLSKSFKYNGIKPFFFLSNEDVATGCYKLEETKRFTDVLLWRDYLPTLAIKRLIGSFNLIKNALVEPKFGEKKNIAISRTFVLPAGACEYHFNLVQEENARKMQYEAVIKNPAFPLKNDVECKLNMTYEYGAEEPYELFFEPKEPRIAGFYRAKVEWSRLEKYPTDNLKAPSFPEMLPWKQLYEYPDRNGKLNVIDELKKYMDECNSACDTICIDRNKLREDKKTGKLFGEVTLLRNNGEYCRVMIFPNSWSDTFDLPEGSVIKCNCRLVPNTKQVERYRISNLWDMRTWNDKLWYKNKYNEWECQVFFEYKGRPTKVFINERNFYFPNKVNEYINDISFEVLENKYDNSLKIVNIHIESGPPLERYVARDIRSPDKPLEPQITGFHKKAFRILFANNRALTGTQVPYDFRTAFAKTADTFTKCFYKSPYIKNKLYYFSILSLASREVGDKYYEMAEKIIEMYKNGTLYGIPLDIGCAFCDLSDDRQKKLMKDTMECLKTDFERVRVLSKALWHNERFVFNADKDLLLNTCLKEAIDHVYNIKNETLLELRNKKNSDKAEGNQYFTVLNEIRICFEYIFGVLRLRGLNEDITDKLSLNNPDIKKLYRTLEAKSKIGIFSYLKPDITDKGEYEYVCDLIYALLVYISGDKGEIRISFDNSYDDDEKEKE